MIIQITKLLILLSMFVTTKSHYSMQSYLLSTSMQSYLLSTKNSQETNDETFLFEEDMDIHENSFKSKPKKGLQTGRHTFHHRSKIYDREQGNHPNRQMYVLRSRDVDDTDTDTIPTPADYPDYPDAGFESSNQFSILRDN